MKKTTLITILMIFFANITFASEVNIFSARHYDSDIQLYEKFTAKTGIKVNIVSGKDKALQKRITEEGVDCVADLYSSLLLLSLQLRGCLQHLKSLFRYLQPANNALQHGEKVR